MNTSDLKERYGDEYPAAIVFDGIRVPLHRETRFSRDYEWADRKQSVQISRFMDGSATITASELRQEWPNWTDDTRMDFCQNSCWLHEQADFSDMLRFIMQNGGPEDWSGIALSVASLLPRDEAFETLVRALHHMEPGRSANISQAISKTKHPEAEATLRRHLAALWAHPALWDDNEFLNWVGFDTITCIEHLIESGAAPSDFKEQVRRLSEHLCSRNRETCQNHLSKYFAWLK